MDGIVVRRARPLLAVVRPRPRGSCRRNGWRSSSSPAASAAPSRQPWVWPARSPVAGDFAEPTATGASSCHLTRTVSRSASGGRPRKASCRRYSRINEIASAKLWRASSFVLPCPFAPGSGCRRTARIHRTRSRPSHVPLTARIFARHKVPVLCRRPTVLAPYSMERRKRRRRNPSDYRLRTSSSRLRRRDVVPIGTRGKPLPELPAIAGCRTRRQGVATY